MMIARVSAAAALVFGIMVSAAIAAPAAPPAHPTTTPATPAPATTKPATPAPAAAKPGAPAPAGAPAGAAAPAAGAPAAGGEPPPPVIGPDGLPITPAAGTPGTPPPPPPVVAPEPEISITPVTMIMNATVVVQVVITWLLGASVLTWALLFSKLTYFSGLGSKTDRFLQAFRGAASIEDAAKVGQRTYRDNPLAIILQAAADEIKLSASGKMSGDQRQHLLSRIAQRMNIAQAEQQEELGTGMGIFATVGSISAFVGLFGTVWGIMNSFIGIAQKQTTNLAVVAPGIAEALFATGTGLFAAVPAVVFYNIFARRIGAYSTRMDNFSNEVLVRLSRQLDGA
jgi:biopolymer transport protein ExbB